MSHAIDARGLRKKYGQRTALDGLDLAVREGSVFGLIGPNGAGKTTTIRLLLDIIRPTSGEVRVLGTTPRAGGAALRRRIGYVPGELRLDARATGRSLLDFYARVSRGNRDAILRHGEDLADRLGLDLRRQVRTLSKGNKQKLGLVQAFMHRPELLILDEPTSGLDPLVQREFLSLVHEARDAGQTVLLSSHVLSEIQQAADDVVVLSAGSIVAEGDVASLRLGGIRHARGLVTGTSPDELELSLAAVSGLSDVRTEHAGDAVRFSARADGGVDGLVKRLAGLTIRELTIEEPDLEESVLSLYGDARTGNGDAGHTHEGTRASRRSRREENAS